MSHNCTICKWYTDSTNIEESLSLLKQFRCCRSTMATQTARLKTHVFEYGYNYTRPELERCHDHAYSTRYESTWLLAFNWTYL